MRWYATIGLVDRPAAMRGRTALYSARHLVQIVAVKRLQAQGLSLAEVQAELTGATDKTLRRVADVPDELVAPEPATLKATPRKRFWTDRPAAAAAVDVGGGADTVTMRAAVNLPGGATLLLPGRPADPDLAAIRAAAGPLIDLLAERGLLEPEEWSST